MDVNGECCNLQYAPDTENIRTLKVERHATIIYRLHTREGDTLGGQQVVTFSRTCCVNASFRSTNCHSKERIQRKAFKGRYSKEEPRTGESCVSIRGAAVMHEAAAARKGAKRYRVEGEQG